MPICAVVLEDRANADQLGVQLAKSNTPIRRCDLIPPSKGVTDKIAKESSDATTSLGKQLPTIEIDQVLIVTCHNRYWRRRRRRMPFYQTEPN